MPHAPLLPASLLLMLTLGPLSFAQQRPEIVLHLSLEEAVARALSDSPRAIQAAEGERMAAARARQARFGWLPLVEASHTWSHGDHPVFVFGSLLEQGRFRPEHFDPSFLNDPSSIDHYRLAVEMTMPIFDQFQRSSSASGARLLLEASQRNRAAAHQTLRLETLSAYYGVRVAHRTLEVAERAVRAAEQDVTQIRDRYESGLLVESDLLAAEVQLSEFRQQGIAARGGLETARAALGALLDLPPDARIELTSDLPQGPFVVDPLELQAALDAHPELLSARLDARTTELEVEKSRGRYLPRIDGFASIATNGDSFGRSSSADRVAGVRISVSLVEPGREGSVAEAQSRHRYAQARVDELENEITFRIVRATQELESARQRLTVAERSLSQAHEAVRIVRDRYEEGLVTITEQLRAQTAVNRAELNHLSALHDLTIGHARLLRAAGRLHDVESFLH